MSAVILNPWRPQMTVSTPEHAAAAVPLPVTHHRTNAVDGLNLFYRQARLECAPSVLLLHGIPTSSCMFHTLIPFLTHRYHVIPPAYSAYRHGATPDHTP